MWGVGDATGVGVGLGDASIIVFLRMRFRVGEAATGDFAAERGVAVATGGAVSVAFCVRSSGCDPDWVGGVPVNSCD